MTSPSRAAQLLDEHQWEPALATLLEAWRRCRIPALADAITALSDLLATGVAPIDGDDPEWETHWQRRVEAKRPAELGVLLPWVTAAPKHQIRRRLVAVLEHGPDPRIGALLVAMIEQPPLTASAQFGTWTDLFAALPDHVDAAVVPRLEARMATRGGKSQFWTKLDAWITAVIPKLAAPAKTPAGWKAELTQLRAALKRLAKLPPPSLAAAPVIAEPGPRVTASSDSLAGARAALDAGQLEQALDAMVSYWAGRRSPALAELIERLGLIVDADKMPGPAGKTKKAQQAAWMAAAQGPAPHAIGPLLASLRDAQLGDVELRIHATLDWQPDPRVAQALMQLVHDIMLGARDGLWRAVYAALVHHADPRYADELHQRNDRLAGPQPFNRQVSEGRALRGVYEGLTAALAAEHELTADQVEHAEAIAATLAARVAAAEAGDQGADAIERSMVEAIVAAWDDDGPRLVYADWLQTRQDPRGDFIALDVGLAQGKKLKGARDKHFKAHKDALLGPIAPLIAWGLEYERGLPRKATVRAKRGALDLPEDLRRAALEDLRWAGFVELVVSYDDEAVGELLERAPLLGLRRLGSPGLAALRGLAKRTDTLGLRELHVSARESDSDEDWAALGQLAAVLPELHTLEIMIWAREGGRVTPPLACFRGALVQRVAVLQNGGEQTGGVARVDEWIDRLAAARCPVPRVELIGPELRAELDQLELGRFALALRLDRLRPGGRELPAVLASLRGIPRERVASLELAVNERADSVRAEIEQALAHLR